MKLALCVIVIAIGVVYISAQGQIENFGDTSGMPVYHRRFQIPAIPNQVQTRWVQSNGVIYMIN